MNLMQKIIIYGEQILNIINSEISLKLEQFKENVNYKKVNKKNNCKVVINKISENEENYCYNIYNDIKINKNQAIIIIIIIFYTIMIIQRKLLWNIYQFSINNSKIYNNLYNDNILILNIKLLYQNLKQKIYFVLLLKMHKKMLI